MPDDNIDCPLARRLAGLALPLHLVFLDGLIKELEVTTKSLMNHHLIGLPIAPSVPLPTIHQLYIVHLEFLIFLQKVSLKNRHIITRRRTRHAKQIFT